MNRLDDLRNPVRRQGVRDRRDQVVVADLDTIFRDVTEIWWAVDEHIVVILKLSVNTRLQDFHRIDGVMHILRDVPQTVLDVDELNAGRKQVQVREIEI